MFVRIVTSVKMFSVVLFFSCFLITGVILGQGFETFDNLPAHSPVNSHQDGSFQGKDGSTWTYVQCRTDLEIDGKAIQIGRNRSPRSYFGSGIISGGIGSLSFDYMQSFSTNVDLDVYVNDILVGNVTSSNQQNEVLHSGIIPVDKEGNFTINFINRINGAGQVVIDNIEWSAYDPLITAPPSFEPEPGTYYEPLSVWLIPEQPDTVIYYTLNLSDPDSNSLTEQPIEITHDTTIKAIAYSNDLPPSNIVTAEYVITLPVAVSTISDLRSRVNDGEVYQLTGKAVITLQGAHSRNQRFIQDSTAGILIDDNNGVIQQSFQIGDAVQNLTGTVGKFENMVQFVPVADFGIAVENNVFPEPLPVTLPELTNENQGRLIQVKRISSIDQGGLFEPNSSYIFQDTDKNTITLRTIFPEPDYIGTFLPENRIHLIGIYSIYGDRHQITPRSLEDFEDVTSVEFWQIFE